MKRIPLLFLLGLAGGFVCAQQPAAIDFSTHNFTLEVQSVANGGQATVTQGPTKSSTTRSVDGSTTASVTTATDSRESKSHTNLQLSVHNLATQADTVTAEWFFMAAPARPQPGAKEFLFDHGAQDVSVSAGATEKLVVSSKEATSLQQRQSSLVHGSDGSVGVMMPGGASAPGANIITGTAIRGWFVRLTAAGKVLAVRGSSQKYEDLAKDQTQINALPTPPTERIPRLH